MEYIYLAPVKGVSDRTFRTVFSSCFGGVDSAIAPFVTASDSGKKLKDLSPVPGDRFRVIPQILTGSDEQFIALARIMADNGSDEINWNLGCPFRKVIDRGEGAALLQEPGLIEKFLDKILSTPLPPVSVKMRTGFRNTDDIFTIAEILNKYPLKEITIHPRTAEQMYDGYVNIGIFSELLKVINHRVIYNGDIREFNDIDAIRKTAEGISGWMIGRGLLMNPFLAEEIYAGRTIDPTEKIQRLRIFTDLLFNQYRSELMSPAHVLDKMRGVWSYLSQSFKDSKKIEKRIRKASNLKHYIDEVNKIFSCDPVINNIESAIKKTPGI